MSHPNSESENTAASIFNWIIKRNPLEKGFLLLGFFLLCGFYAVIIITDKPEEPGILKTTDCATAKGYHRDAEMRYLTYTINNNGREDKTGKIYKRIAELQEEQVLRVCGDV